MKKQYTYQVGGIGVSTRAAARLIQQHFRNTATPLDDGTPCKAPRILQKITMERVVR